MDSAFFLEYTKEELRKIGAKIINIDLTIICEKPKIMPHSEAMRANVARVLKIHSNQVSIKLQLLKKWGF